MKRIVLSATAIVALCLMGCTDETTSNPETQNVDSKQEEITNEANSFISLFEIPATDLSRAVNFYQAILGIQIEKMEMPGMEMGVFPYEEQMVTGVIMKGEGYQPSADGVTIYLDGGDDLQLILDKVEKNGGKVILPKTPHADDNGFFALFLDTEGNKLGLNSPN